MGLVVVDCVVVTLVFWLAGWFCDLSRSVGVLLVYVLVFCFWVLWFVLLLLCWFCLLVVCCLIRCLLLAINCKWVCFRLLRFLGLMVVWFVSLS